MSTKSIEQFYAGKTLEIPPYQRDYAWETRNVDQLFDDIIEAMEVGEGHYLGTFILSISGSLNNFKVVDGQQRLTTLTMIFDAMVNALSDGELKNHYTFTFLRHPVYGPKFSVLGNNQKFFTDLLNGNNPRPDSQGQNRLLSAYDWIRARTSAIKQSGGEEAIQNWLKEIGKLEVLEFLEPNEGKAIRMFQSVNDRGVPLSKMDIAKSLLIYYSNRFIKDSLLDQYISEKFGEAFRHYSLIKELSTEDGYKIKQIDRSNFREDDIFRYHYFAFSVVNYEAVDKFDYSATSETVLEDFLKPTLKKLRTDRNKLKLFIEGYVNHLASFFATLEDIIKKTRTDKDLYMLFVVGDLAATMYPLTIQLAMRNVLYEHPLSSSNLTLLDMIGIVDLRVFKIRGTNPQTDILWLTRESGEKPIDEIASHLKWFIGKFMDNGLFESILNKQNVYGNSGLVRILSAVEDKKRLDHNMNELSVNELATLVKHGQTVEHILSVEPSFGIEAYGFHNKEAYELNIHRIGNLTLLTRSENSTCSNKTVETKIKEKKMYRSSLYYITRDIAAKGINSGVSFSKDSIDTRSTELSTFCVSRWPIW